MKKFLLRAVLSLLGFLALGVAFMGNDVQAAACPQGQEGCNDAQCGSAQGGLYWQSSAPSNSEACDKGSLRDLTRASNRWTWTCRGRAPDGADTNCASRAMPMNGSCGSANGKLLFHPPSGNTLCTAPSYLVGSAPSGSGPWNRSCRGPNSNASCSAQEDTRTFAREISDRGACYEDTSVTGVCSGTYTEPAGVCGRENQRVAGSTATSGGGEGPYEGWLCSYFQSPLECSNPSNPWLTHSCTWRTNGQRTVSCGGLSQSLCNGKPTCTRNVNQHTQTLQDRSVVCKDNNGNTVANSFCSSPVPATKRVATPAQCNTQPPAPVCGSANGQVFPVKPTTNLCAIGTATPVGGNGNPWTWLCQNGGNSVSCSATRSTTPIIPSCGVANGVPTSQPPAGNTLCDSGSPIPIIPTLSGTNYIWNCVGANGGGSVACSAPHEVATSCVPYAGGMPTSNITPSTSEIAVMLSAPNNSLNSQVKSVMANSYTFTGVLTPTQYLKVTLTNLRGSGGGFGGYGTYEEQFIQYRATNTVIGGQEGYGVTPGRFYGCNAPQWNTSNPLSWNYNSSYTNGMMADRLFGDAGRGWVYPNNAISQFLAWNKAGKGFRVNCEVCELTDPITTNVVACTNKPANTVRNTVSEITQNLNGSGVWVPSATSVYNVNPSTTRCRYKCEANYTRNGSACVQNTSYAWDTGPWGECSVAGGSCSGTMNAKVGWDDVQWADDYYNGGSCENGSDPWSCIDSMDRSNRPNAPNGGDGVVFNEAREAIAYCPPNYGNDCITYFTEYGIRNAGEHYIQLRLQGQNPAWYDVTVAFGGQRVGNPVYKAWHTRTACDFFTDAGICSSFPGCSWTPSGPSTKTRVVVCKDNNGNVVSDSLCGDLKPMTSKACDTNTTCRVDTSVGGACFIADTLVMLADGSSKPIQDIAIGDTLKAVNGVNTVKALLRPLLGDQDIYSINHEDAFFTANHPFLTTEGWKSLDPELTKKEIPELDISLLEVGDILITEGKEVRITSLTPSSRIPSTPLYNLELDGDHTYFANGYAVHNKLSPEEPDSELGRSCIENSDCRSRVAGKPAMACDNDTKTCKYTRPYAGFMCILSGPNKNWQGAGCGDWAQTNYVGQCG